MNAAGAGLRAERPPRGASRLGAARRQPAGRGARAVAATVGLLGAPQAAFAHSPVAGIDDFYAGMLHPVVVPQALIALLAVGLLLGQHRMHRAGRAVAALPAGIAVGLAAGATGSFEVQPWAVLLGATVAAFAALAALDVAPAALAILCAVLGAIVGAALSEPDAAGGGAWIIAAGTWLGALLGALGTAAVAELASRPWQRVAVRVVASWLTASAVLMLALGWLGTQPPPAERAASAAASAR